MRLLHWTLAVCVFAAYLFDDPQWFHDWAGYVALGAVGFRAVWGFVGPQHARFVSFVRGPAPTLGYLGQIASGHPARYLGHNPAGGAMIVALLAMVALTAGSGWLMTTDRFWGNDIVEDLHEVAANTTMMLVALHLLGVLLASLQHGENLAKAMITGYKQRGPMDRHAAE